MHEGIEEYNSRRRWIIQKPGWIQTSMVALRRMFFLAVEELGIERVAVEDKRSFNSML